MRYYVGTRRTCPFCERMIYNMELSPVLYHRLIRPKWFNRIFVDNVIKNKYDFAGKSVLDFGSGTGASSQMFAPASYLGVEIDLGRVEFARKLNPKHKFEVLQVGQELPLEDGSLDYVVIISVLHHIPAEMIPGYLKDFRRILKPGGEVLVIEPCFSNESKVCNNWMGCFDKGKFIQNLAGYTKPFSESGYQVTVHGQYRQLFLYNKVFFSATPI